MKPKSKADAFCKLSDGSLIYLTRITDTHIKGKKFRNLQDFYDAPILSSQMGIYQTTGLANSVSEWVRGDCRIVSKYMRLSYHGNTILVPLIHTSE